ncbi:MAG: intermembrane transport protein PqiB, partial [Gammaproteobacteria bacterium]
VMIAPGLGSLGVGSPIYYQGIHAGEVLGYELANDQHSVLVHGFVKAPYDAMVKANTRFWNVSGMNLSLSADGLEVQTESLESIMFGGIAFETPPTLEPVKEDVKGIVFTLFADRDAIEESSYTQKVQFVLFFDGSVRGLSPGAPVEFYGIRVGSVKDLRLEYDLDENSFRLPVLIELEPQRIIPRGGEANGATSGGAKPGQAELDRLQLINDLVDQGLRARLEMGSLITGQLFVDLVMLPDTEIQQADASVAIPQLPTVPAKLDQLAGSVEGVLKQLGEVDFAGISDELKQTLEGANELVHSQHLKQALVELENTLKGSSELANDAGLRATLARLDESSRSLNVILSAFEKRADSLAGNSDAALSEGHKALAQARKTMTLIDAILAEDSQMQYNANRMTRELAETARSIRNFVQYLERNPDAMLFGKRPAR